MDLKLLFKCEVILLLCSCNQQVPFQKDYPILQVNLVETKTSLFDIFEKIELIPLETNEKSLIKRTAKLKYHHDYYLLDNALNSVFIFDNAGKYVDKIHRVGNGPGEYWLIYDFFIDTLQSQIGVLSPIGEVLYYSLQGDFIKEVDLPHPPPAYRHVELLPENTCLFWSFTETGNKWDALNIVSMETGEKKWGSTYDENSALLMWTYEVFHRDEKGNVYFIRSFSNDVFTVTPNGLKVAYSWDFGSQNINIKKYKFPKSPNRSENAQKFAQSFNSGDIRSLSYCIPFQTQTDLYYYATLRFPFNRSKHLFYHKQTHEYFLFERTAEDILINRPLLVTNEYMIAELDYEERENIKSYLFSDEDRENLAKFKEDDNPCLVKYVFRK